MIVFLLTRDLFRQQLLSPVEINLCQLECGVAFIECGNAGMQLGDPVIDILYGVLQLKEQAPGLCFNAAHRGCGRLKICLCCVDSRFLHGDRVLEGLLVQLGEKISLMNTVVIIDQHAGDLSAYASSNECDVAVHVGVIRRDGVERQSDPRNAEYQGGHQHQNFRHSNHQPSFQSRPMLAGGGCAGRKILVGICFPAQPKGLFRLRGGRRSGSTRGYPRFVVQP